MAHPGAHTVWNTPATVTGGTSDTSVMVRYPDGLLIPVAVPAGSTATDYARALRALDGYTITAARRTIGGNAYESSV